MDISLVLVFLGYTFIILGISTLIIGFILNFFKNSSQKDGSETSAIILIGPIPIIIGKGKKSKKLIIILAIIGFILTLSLFLFQMWLQR